ncbi:MAG: hypothetical protein J2P25_12925 [Nocardiopsaceae bacterium]|nr:hypothetical protein [Nocardiopsaceae bacterium]
MMPADEFLDDLPRLHAMITLTLERPPGFQEPRPGTRYRIETFPARYARVMRQPHRRLYDLESVEVARVYRLLYWGVEHWGVDLDDLVEISWEREEEWYRDLDLDLRAHAGKTLAEAARELLPLLGQLGDVQPPSASELPYHADFGWVFVHLATIADHFINQRTLHRLPEADATAWVIERIAAREPWDPLRFIAAPDGIGKLRMLLATTREQDGSELGLAHPAGPADGWLPWYRRVLDRVQDVVREENASLDPAAAMVTAPGAAVPEPPGLADPRYRYAARFAAAYEGGPVTDTNAAPSAHSRRFHRAHQAARLLFTDAYGLLCDQAARLIADAGRSPGLLERVLGPPPAGQEGDLAEALGTALGWYASDRMLNQPSPTLQEVPMNRWEVRFRYPELLDLCTRLPSGGGPPGLGAAVASFTAAREPCRVWLPPVVGELHEIVNLLPFDRDLGYAMTHLGAGDGGGDAWRGALLRAADDITAHIWHHEDHPGQPPGCQPEAPGGAPG